MPVLKSVIDASHYGYITLKELMEDMYWHLHIPTLETLDRETVQMAND